VEVLITIDRSPLSVCLLSLKRQIESALKDIDPWKVGEVSVRVRLHEYALAEDEAMGLSLVLRRLEDPAEGWRLDLNATPWRTFVEQYEFTAKFRCIAFKDLVNG